MKCPYCISDINENASACPRCAQDLRIFGDLLRRVHVLEANAGRVVTVTAPLPASTSASESGTDSTASSKSDSSTPEIVTTSKGAPHTFLDASVTASAATVDPGVIPTNFVQPTAAMNPAALRIGFWCFSALALVLMHSVLTVVLNAPLIWLRVLSILVPLPFGFLSRANPALRVWSVPAAVLTTLASVFAMSVVIALVDGTTVLPANRADVRDLIVYSISILFSFFAGMALEWLAASTIGSSVRAPKAAPGQLAFVMKYLNPEHIEERAQRLQKTVASLTVAAASLTAAVSGLQGLIGGK